MAENNAKLFVMVPASATTFNGATVSAASPKKIFFEAAKNTIWVAGVAYGIDPDTLAQITGNTQSIADLVALIGESKKGESEETIINRIAALEGGNFVTTARTIAGIDLADDITSAELTAALDAATAGDTGKQGMMSAADKTKLDGIEAGAQVNVIEGVKFNGTALTPDTDKVVSLEAVTDVKIGETSIVTDHVASFATKSAYDASTNKIITENDIKDLEGAMHFRGVFDKLEDVEDPKAGDVAIVGVKEYVYGGTPAAWTELGDETMFVTKTTTIAGVDLQDNITKAELLTALNVEDGAQVNVLEGITVNGTDVAIADKKVELNGSVEKLSTGYTIASSYVAPATGDTLDVAIGKLAKGVDSAMSSGVAEIGGATGAVKLAESATEVQLAATSGANGTLSASLVDGGVATAKLADGAVTADKLGAEAVETAKIKDANVTEAKLADSAVTATKIADAAVESAKIADNAVTTAKIADEAVTIAKIADAALAEGTASGATNDKLATSDYVDEAVEGATEGLDAEVETEAEATKLKDTSIYAKVVEEDGLLTSVVVEFDPWEEYK